MDAAHRSYDVMHPAAACRSRCGRAACRSRQAAQRQLRNTARLPFIFKLVAVMPDVHVGIGATVGCVIPTKGAIIPAAVGVDIGCGMMAVRTSLTASDLPDNLAGVRSAIERRCRTAARRRRRQARQGRVGRPAGARSSRPGRRSRRASSAIVDKHPQARRAPTTSMHLGTLGTGNHFIEVCLDEEDRVWVMLHSGSRGVGNRDRQLLHRAGEAGHAQVLHQPAGPGPRLPPGGDRALRRLRRGGRLGAGLRGAEPAS